MRIAIRITIRVTIRVTMRIAIRIATRVTLGIATRVTVSRLGMIRRCRTTATDNSGDVRCNDCHGSSVPMRAGLLLVLLAQGCIAVGLQPQFHPQSVASSGCWVECLRGSSIHEGQAEARGAVRPKSET